MGQADRSGNPDGTTAKQFHLIRAILNDVERMVEAAYVKHATMHSPHEGHSVIREEFEELWEHIRADTGRTPEARKEALQLAAMAIRYIVDLIDGDDR